MFMNSASGFPQYSMLLHGQFLFLPLYTLMLDVQLFISKQYEINAFSKFPAEWGERAMQRAYKKMCNLQKAAATFHLETYRQSTN